MHAIATHLHREAEGPAEVADEEELEEVVNGRVDPSSTLREEDAERVGDDGLADSLRAEHHLALGEGLEHERRKVAILAEEQEVLLVERVDDVLRIVLNDVRVGEDGHPVAVVPLGGLDPVHRKAAGQAGDAAEHRLECLGQVVGNVVLEDCAGKLNAEVAFRNGKLHTLDHRHPRLRLVGDLGLAAETHDLRVVDHAGRHAGQRVREDL